MSEAEALFNVLRQSADADCVAAIEQAVATATDRELCRINVLDFAKKTGINRSARLTHSCTAPASASSTCRGICCALAVVACSITAPR